MCRSDAKIRFFPRFSLLGPRRDAVGGRTRLGLPRAFEPYTCTSCRGRSAASTFCWVGAPGKHISPYGGFLPAGEVALFDAAFFGVGAADKHALEDARPGGRVTGLSAAEAENRLNTPARKTQEKRQTTPGMSSASSRSPDSPGPNPSGAIFSNRWHLY